MKVKFTGRLINENTEWEMICDLNKDDYSVSRREISVVVEVNGKYQESLKEHFTAEIV